MSITLPRRDERHPLEVDAKVRVVSGWSDSATIFDISTTGCQVDLPAAFLEKDRTVLIRLEGLESLVGRVRWVKGRKAGILFERPLNVAVVDYVALTHPRVEFSHVA
jgi:hypothetical protein